MKIAIVGNSHVTSLKQALVNSKEFSVLSDSVDFYAAPARLAHKLAVTSNEIIPTDKDTAKYYKATSKGSGSINIDEYDLIWLYGLTRPLDKLIKYEREVYSSKKYSQAVIESSFVERSNIGCKIATKITGTKVLITPRPVPSSKALTETNIFITTELEENVFLMLTEWFNFESDVSILCPPQRSYIKSREGYFTDPIYSEGAHGLGSLTSIKGTETKQDYLHMNEKFGALMWAQLFDLFANK